MSEERKLLFTIKWAIIIIIIIIIIMHGFAVFIFYIRVSIS